MFWFLVNLLKTGRVAKWCVMMHHIISDFYSIQSMVVFWDVQGGHAQGLSLPSIDPPSETWPKLISVLTTADANLLPAVHISCHFHS